MSSDRESERARRERDRTNNIIHDGRIQYTPAFTASGLPQKGERQLRIGLRPANGVGTWRDDPCRCRTTVWLAATKCAHCLRTKGQKVCAQNLSSAQA